MPTQAQVPDIVAKVRRRLANAAKKGVHLRVVGDKLEDGWLYVEVVPSRPGGSASDHARVMSQVERELRKKGIDRLLIVPTLEE